jgi:hypothetical protein
MFSLLSDKLGRKITQLWITHSKLSTRQYDSHLAQHGSPPEEFSKEFTNSYARATAHMNKKMLAVIIDYHVVLNPTPEKGWDLVQQYC